MTDWYRNTDWSDSIALDFDTRLARSRGQQAQYLTLQGQALIPAHPDVAAVLLARAVAMDDEFQTVRALAFLAQARLALADVTGALEAYEEGLTRQLAQPNIVAVQPADYLFVIGYFRREDRLADALQIAEAMPDDGLFGPDPQITAAKAMVFDLAGRAEQAKSAAALALPLLDELGEGEALGVNLAELRSRLMEIAERAA